MEIKFRAWIEEYNYFAIQGAPDLETLQSFIYHWGDRKLEQFSGMPDKNNKEICQNDKVKYLNYICVVVWKYGSLVLDILEGDKKGFFYLSDMGNRHLEIIGSTHDQLKLFKNDN